MTMRRNAILRKLAAKKLVITDKMLTAEYNRQYGEKVSIRHIQCASLADAQKMLDRIAKGEDFAQLARDFSINKQTAPQGGLLPPFSRDDEAASLTIRDIAFGLADGKVSEIVQVDKHFHVLKREKTIPPTEAPAFESVKEELRKRLAAANIRPMQTRLLRDLHNAADLRVIDPVLKETTALEAVKAVGD
jgi:parvulin-like peptidyl-prolyl isomerase